MSGKRMDGRGFDETRPVEMEVGVVKNANGSAIVRLGETVALAAVYGPKEMHPKHMQEGEKAVLKCHYTMAPFSTKERVRPGPSRRSNEISKVTRDALEAVLYLEDFPKASIELFIIILQANAGTRTAGINAGSLALADAGIKMNDLVASVAAGKIGDNYVIDLAGKEEEETFCDLPVAYSPRTKQVTLLQMDGDLAVKDVKEVMKLAIKGCESLYELQKEALRKKYSKEVLK